MGYRAEAVNRLITVNTDTVLETLLPLIVRRIGPPPVPFVFLALGSEGRREQTLCTDQDNAILYADPPENGAAAAAVYFLEMGRQVCDGLARAGYAFCKGGIMASQPAWCRSLSAWQREATMWIRTLEARDLLQAKIFFDYRPGFGDASLLDPLRMALQKAIGDHPRFLSQLALNVLLFRPPSGSSAASRATTRISNACPGLCRPTGTYSRISPAAACKRWTAAAASAWAGPPTWTRTPRHAAPRSDRRTSKPACGIRGDRWT